MAKVEKNIPIPNKYPFEALRINESFVYSDYTNAKHKCLGGLISYYQKKTGNKFSGRKDADSLLRVWRIA